MTAAPQRYDQLTPEIEALEVKSLVEIGTWNGRRARQLVSAALKNVRHVQYHGFDLFEALTDKDLEEELSKRPPSRDEVAKGLRSYRRRIHVQTGLLPGLRRSFDFDLHPGYTRDSLPAFVQANPGFRADFVFIDGGHKVETIANDWAWSTRMLAPRGVVVLDDYYADEELTREFGCNQLIAQLENDPEWDVTILPVTDTFPRIGSVQFAKAMRR